MSGPEDAPILEFDPAATAVIEPSEHIEPIDIAPHAVLCFFQDVIEKVVEEHGGRVIDHVVSEIGRNPVYELDIDGRPLALVHPGVGAPLAAGFLEEMIARGCRAFVACGGAGVLVPDVALGHVIVPSSAVRDEGTSYHYLPAAREVEPTRQAFDAIVATLEPVLATVVAWVWLGETFGPIQLVGGAVVLAGIFLAQSAR